MGAALARLRRETGLTQTQFGEMVGASRPWVSDLERGNLRGGQLDTALACIHALGYRIVLAGIDTKPSVLDDLKNSMRRGPLARRVDSGSENHP
ncbi:helix-turn-helix transcriptional regulator [Candidatus Poriferisodalis sp.]|uniref:helix-turn-helix transcriptional regulator n=1 Tax=Candidatus Poriferisodalis sp. TaxID=3101277 RepID=UPI003B527340